MKTRFILSFVLITILSGCKKNATTYSDSGTLTGFDYRMCACCGGIFLESDTKMYHIESLPGMSNEDFNKILFPKRIRYNWVPDRDCAGNIYIKITTYAFY